MATTDAPGALATVAATHQSSRGQASSSKTLATALVVLRLRDEDIAGDWPTVRDVARFFGLSPDATHKRLFSAVWDGWLVHREGRRGAFRPSAQLFEYLRSTENPAEDL